MSAGGGASQSALRRTHPHILAQGIRRRRNQDPSEDTPESDQDVEDRDTFEKDDADNEDDDDQEAMGGADEEDDGDQDEVIRCICTYSDDDGNTIACDECAVWQHMICVGVDPADVPDQYHCEECAPRPVDPRAANELQKNQRAKKTSESPSDSSKGKRKTRRKHRVPPQHASEDHSPAPPPLRRAELMEEARASRAANRGRGRPRGRARSSKESSSTRIANTSTSRGGLTSSPELRRKVKEPNAVLLARRARAPPQEMIYHHDRAREKRIEEERPRPSDVFEHEYNAYSTRYAELSFPRFATEDVGDKIENVCARWDDKMDTDDDVRNCEPTELNVVSARWLAERIPVAICDPLPADPVSNVKRFGLFATSKIPANFYVTDVQGTIITSAQEGGDDETALSSLPPQVSIDSIKLLAPYVFEHPAQMNLERGMMVDARAWSSGAGRFVRRACSSNAPCINAHLRSVILKEDLPNNLRNPVNSRILLAIYTSRELRPSEEIILAPSSSGCLGYPCACDDETVCHTAKLVDQYERQRRLNMEQKRLLQASLRRSYSGDQLDETTSVDVALSSSQEEMGDGPEPEPLSDSGGGGGGVDGGGEKAGQKNIGGDSGNSSPPSRADTTASGGKIANNSASKSLSREEKKLQDQLARIERMEREAERKRARKQRRRTKSGEASEDAAAVPGRKRAREDSTTELDVDSESDDEVAPASKRRKQGASAELASGQSTPLHEGNSSRANTSPKPSSPRLAPVSKWHQPGRKLGFKGWIYAQEEARIAREAALKAELAAAAARSEKMPIDSAARTDIAVEPSDPQKRSESNSPAQLIQQTALTEGGQSDALATKIKVESDDQPNAPERGRLGAEPSTPVLRASEPNAVHPSVAAIAAPPPVRKVSLAEFMANKKARSEAALAEAALAAANATSAPPEDTAKTTEKPVRPSSPDSTSTKEEPVPQNDQKSSDYAFSKSIPAPRDTPVNRVEDRGPRILGPGSGQEQATRHPGAASPTYNSEARRLPPAGGGRSVSPNTRETYGYISPRSRRGSLGEGDPRGAFPAGMDRRLSMAYSNASEPSEMDQLRQYRRPSMMDSHTPFHHPSRSGSISYGVSPASAAPGPHIHPSRAQLRSPPPPSPAHDPYRTHPGPPTPHRPYLNPERERAFQGGPPPPFPVHPERGSAFPRGRGGVADGGRGAFRRHPGPRYPHGGPPREYFDRPDVLDSERPPRSADNRRDWDRGPPGEWERERELDRERDWELAQRRERAALPPADIGSGSFAPDTPIHSRAAPEAGVLIAGEHPQRKRRRDSDVPGDGRLDGSWIAESPHHALPREEPWTSRQRPVSPEPPSLIVRRLSMISPAATPLSGRPPSPEPTRARDFGRRDDRNERDDGRATPALGGPGQTGVAVRVNRVENSMSEDRLRRLSEPERHEPRWAPGGGRGGTDGFGPPPPFQSKRSRRRGGVGTARRSRSRDLSLSARNIWPPEPPPPKRQRIAAAPDTAGTSASSRSGSPRSRHSGVSSQPHSPPRLRIVTLDPDAPPSAPPATSARVGSRSLSPRSRSPGSSYAGDNYDFGGGYPSAPRSGRPLSSSGRSGSSSRRRRSDIGPGGPSLVPVRIISIGGGEGGSSSNRREDRSSSPRPSSGAGDGGGERYHPYARPGAHSAASPAPRIGPRTPPPLPQGSIAGEQQRQRRSMSPPSRLRARSPVLDGDSGRQEGAASPTASAPPPPPPSARSPR
ncbi:hypothetical protein HDU86_006600 [Geranomyces michiganensis]|nr:hypothetical protein HDU86_006600 [Geranomyces michiganensis]